MGRCSKIGIAFIASVLATVNCEKKPVEPEDQTPTISEAKVPGVIWTETVEDFLISVFVSDPQGLGDIDTVELSILRPYFTTVAVAFSTVLNDSGKLGDLIAFDGIYSRQINSSFTQDQPGEYRFVFQAIDSQGHESNTITLAVPVHAGTKNEPPQIVEVVLPEVLSVDQSIAYIFNVKVVDPQGAPDIAALIYRIHSRENPTVLETDTLYEQEGGLFTHQFRSAFADSVVGVYPFSFQAFDRSYAATDLVRRDVKVINEANAPPTIFNLSCPDTFDSSSPINHFLISLEVMDPQGLSDVDSVYFTSRKPDGTMANEGRPILLVDDGTYGDVRPGDGVYSFKAIFDPTAQKGDYTFTFSAVDRSRARSNTIVHILTVI